MGKDDERRKKEIESTVEIFLCFFVFFV